MIYIWLDGRYEAPALSTLHPYIEDELFTCYPLFPYIGDMYPGRRTPRER